MSKVLYAEDEYTNRKLLELLLRKEGVDCDLAEDGVAALEMYYHNEYSVVILDHYMPGLSGAEVAQKIRAVDQSITLIALTSDDSQIPALRQAGFDRVFLKPLRGGDYIGAIVSYT